MAAATNGRSSSTTITTLQQLHHRQQRPQKPATASRWHPQQGQRRSSNDTPSRFVPGPAPASKHNKAPAGESWFVNASGRSVAPATGYAAAAASSAAGNGPAAGAAGGPGSPIITALRVQATPENILPVPMVVGSSSSGGGGGCGGGGTVPEINAKCPECQDLVKARLDEPTLMSEDRHRWEDGAFGGEGGGASETLLESGAGGRQEAAAAAAAGSTARRAASAWRLRELTRTFNVGIILCLNFG
ncbi:unnamed protein product, partial [Ectocarpus fasciculatus]